MPAYVYTENRTEYQKRKAKHKITIDRPTDADNWWIEDEIKWSRSIQNIPKIY
jgi:hypothetical protein